MTSPVSVGWNIDFEFWDPNDAIIPRTFIKQIHMVAALVYVNLGAPIAAKTL